MRQQLIAAPINVAVFKETRALGYTATSALHIVREIQCYGRVVSFEPLYACWRRLTGTAR